MRLLYLLLFVCTVSSVFYGQDVTEKKEILFDGNNLDHWRIPEGNIWWSIKGKSLWVKSGPDKKGSILWTKAEYDDFIVQLDFKFGKGTIDSGIFMRGDDARNAQIQIGISGSLKRDMTASPYVPKKGYPVEAEGVDKLLKKKGWNTIKAMAVGNSYKVWLNGKEVMNYTLEQANLEGPIGLQLHSKRDMTIQFRNISVIEL